MDTKFHSQRCLSLRKLTECMYLLELGPSDNTEVSKDMKYPQLDTAENKLWCTKHFKHYKHQCEETYR